MTHIGRDPHVKLQICPVGVDRSLVFCDYLVVTHQELSAKKKQKGNNGRARKSTILAS